MTETLNWDHTMVDVTNLQDAIDYFNSKGLAFTPGGHHEYWGTKNALDYFGLNYIELLTVANKEKAKAFPYENNSAIHDAVEDYFAGIQRITTIAIRTDNIEETHRRLKGLGLNVGDITDSGCFSTGFILGSCKIGNSGAIKFCLLSDDMSAV